MVAEDFRLTLVVVIVKLADELPDGIVTVAGRFAQLGLLLNKLTTNPPEDAGALRVTAPLAVLPPITIVGLSVNEAKLVTDVGGVRVIAADFVTAL